MQRDIRAEITAAVTVVVALMVILAFALVLSTAEQPGTDVTAVADNSASATATLTATATVTETASATDTPQPTVTTTATPTQTATATVTRTPEPAAIDTATATATITQTPEPIATDAQSVAETEPESGSVADTSTATDAAGNTPTLTPTVTATLTTTPESTVTSSATRTVEPSVVTPVQVTETPTQGSQPDTGILPTPPASPTPQPADAPTRTPATCELPSGWVTYDVQPGNTLFAIALATRSSLDTLRYANCIDDVDDIVAGQTVYVPRAPVEPVVTTVPSGIRPGLTKIGCDDPRTQITSPIIGQRLNGAFTVYGTATRDEFWYYKLEIRPDQAEIYNFYSRSEGRVQNGVLGQVNADIFGDGLHWLRLTVVDIRGGIPPGAVCEVPVYFD